MTTKKDDCVAHIIVEIRNGKAWWIVSDKKVKATIMNHDEGMIRHVPTDIRGAGYVEDITKLAEQMDESGLYAEYEKKLAAIDPDMYARLKKVEEKEK